MWFHFVVCEKSQGPSRFPGSASYSKNRATSHCFFKVSLRKLVRCSHETSGGGSTGWGEGGPGAPAAWPRLTKPKAYSSQGAQIVNCHISLSVSLLLALRSRFDIVDIFFSFVALGKIKANNIFFPTTSSCNFINVKTLAQWVLFDNNNQNIMGFVYWMQITLSGLLNLLMTKKRY